MTSDDRGFASVVLLAELVVVAFACLALSDVASVLAARVRATAAADAAALAAAARQWPFLGAGDDPGSAAAALAQGNGARLESCRCPVRGTSAFVTVSVATRVRLLRGGPSRVEATATAVLDPGGVFRAPG